MTTRTPAILGAVAGWWLFVIFPGVLTVAGVFGDLDAGSTIPGRLILTWLLFYLAQLAMVYVIGDVVGHTRTSWYVIASLLPWLVDWASPVAIGWGLAAIAVAGGFAVLVAVLVLRTEALDTNGIQVEATVVKVLRNYMNIVINNVYIRRRIRVEYTLPDGTKQQRTMGMLCEIGTGPVAGDHLKLRVDPKHTHHIAIDPSELT